MLKGAFVLSPGACHEFPYYVPRVEPQDEEIHDVQRLPGDTLRESGQPCQCLALGFAL